MVHLAAQILVIGNIEHEPSHLSLSAYSYSSCDYRGDEHPFYIASAINAGQY